MAYDIETGDSRCDTCHGGADCACNEATDWRAMVRALRAVEERFYGETTEDTAGRFAAMCRARDALIDAAVTERDAPEVVTEYATAHLAHLAVVARQYSVGVQDAYPPCPANERAADRSIDAERALRAWVGR